MKLRCKLLGHLYPSGIGLIQMLEQDITCLRCGYVRKGRKPPLMPEVKQPAKVNTNYMIGQRVLYQGVICTVCRPKHDLGDWDYWIDNPEKGHAHGVYNLSIHALPGGQL